MIFVLFLFGMALVFAGGGSKEKPASSKTMKIEGAGASFPNEVYQSWIYLYNDASGNNVSYQAIGSSGGINQITERNVDFGGTDAPLTKEEQDEKNLWQFPAVMGGIVVIVNLEGVESGQIKLDGNTLAEIFLGNITDWSDPAIQALNPDLTDLTGAITVVHRSDGSGTTANFTLYLDAVSESWKNGPGSGKAIEWPIGVGGKKNDGVSTAVKQTPGAIGYVEYSHAVSAELPYTSLQNADGNFVMPTINAFKAAAGNANWDRSMGYSLSLINGPGGETWPITTPSFIMIPRDEDKKETVKSVVAFYDWAFANGQEAAIGLGFVPLPDSLIQDIQSYWSENGLY